MGKILSRPWLLLILAPFLYLAPILADPTQVHTSPGSEFSDLVVAHWPSAEFLRQSLQEYGEIPFWNPHTLGGTPFAANPLSGLYYPPLWLALVISPPLAFNILFFLHLAFAGMGVYFLAREEGAGQFGSLLAGIAFGGLPKLVAHTAAGHLTLVLAVSWTPWLILVARDAARHRSIRKWSLAGVMAGILFLIDPRWVIPSALVALGNAFFSGMDSPAKESRRSIIFLWAKNIAVFGGFAMAISAVLALPMAELVSLSTRANISGSEAATLSLPLLSLLGLFFGGIGSSVEWVVYPGAVVLVSALASLPIALSRRTPASRGQAPGEGERGGEGWFWFLLFLLSVILSLGSTIPGLATVMNAVPGIDLLRVPPRWMFLAGLALAMLAARGFTRLETVTDERGVIKKFGFSLAAGGVILAAVSGTMGLPAALWQDGLIWGGLGIILFIGFFSTRRRWEASGVLVCLAVLDLAIADGRMIDRNPVDPIPADEMQVVSFLGKEGEDYRVFSPSSSITHLAAVQYELRMLDGIDPLILQSTADIVSAAAGLPQTGYSVTLPAFATGTPKTDNREAVPDWRLLGLLNVRYLASAFEIHGGTPGELSSYSGTYLYLNPASRPRTWVAESLDAWDLQIAGREVRIESDTPNRMRLTAVGPGIIVISEANYPAWRATVDGKTAELKTVGGWWRAVEIGPGEHSLEIAYIPTLSQIGLAITLLALAAFMGVRRWAT